MVTRTAMSDNGDVAIYVMSTMILYCHQNQPQSYVKRENGRLENYVLRHKHSRVPREVPFRNVTLHIIWRA